MSSDIAKCDGENCKKRDHCFRYTAKSHPFMQCYLTPEIIDDICYSYIEDKRSSPKEQK